MNPQRRSGVSNPLLVTRVGLLNVELLEFLECLVKHDVTIEHVFDYCFETGAYLHLLCPNLPGRIQSAFEPAHFKIKACLRLSTRTLRDTVRSLLEQFP